MKLAVSLSFPPKDIGDFRKMHYDALSKDPSAIMLIKRGMGLGYDAVLMSLHEDYSSYDKFRAFIQQNMTERIIDVGTFLVNLEEEQSSLPFSFNLIATQLLALPCKGKTG